MSDFNAEPIWDALLPRAFPGQDVTWRGNAGEQHALVRCVLAGCTHKNGDANPSLTLFRDGGFLCRTNGTKGGMRELVARTLGEDAWRELGRLGAGRGLGGKRDAEPLPVIWARLFHETAWTERYHISYELSRRYLRSGPRWPHDIRLETSIGIFDQGGQLVGIKSRLPQGLTWPGPARTATAKYRCAPGSEIKHAVFLLDRAQANPLATVVVVAGEKDALVAASHLDPARWAPVSGCGGEGSVPPGIGYLLAGRRVVVAYDPDEAGRAGAMKVVRALRGKAADVRVATMPPGEGPRGEGKWDVAAVLLAEGPESLVRILEAAEPVSAYREPGSDEDEGDAPDAGAGEDGASPPDGAPPAPPGDGPPADLPVDDPMTAWRVQKGRIGEVLGSAKGLRFAPRFDGTLQILRVESRYSEDPETPGAWVRERRETIKATLADGREVTETIEAGREAFGRMLDEHFPAESHVHLLAERARLWQYMHRVSTPEVAETRRAVGPSRDLGWLCPPHWSVRDGALARAPFAVEPPGAAQELRRYRLADLPLERLRELGRWVVDVLLRCDHHDGALTLPLLGAVLVPPLWHYVPTFSSWQRYAFFVQGGSGVGKTQLTRFFMSFWGDFLNPDGLSTWRDSATTIEDLLHRVVGAPVFVSDWKKANFTRDTEKQARALIQSYGDRSARGRSNVKAESQRKKEPRCQFLLDGEDLPEGQESTLGRMVIIKAEATEPTKRCATTDDLPGAARNVPDLPGLTAAWIAWVQRNVPALTADLEAARDEVEAALPQGSANRSRIVRAYAAQVLAVRSFGTFLEQVMGLTGVVGPLHARSLEVHAAHGTAQLEHVQSESAGDAFVRGLVAVLQAGKAMVRPKSEHSGENPWPGGQGASACVGVYSRVEDTAEIWPEVALPIVQQHVSAGGGERIDFSRDAIGQQLRQQKVITEGRARLRGEGGKVMRPRTWCFSLASLGVEDEQATLGGAGWPGHAGEPRARLEGLPE